MNDFLAKHRIHIGLTLISVIIIASGLLIYGKEKSAFVPTQDSQLSELNRLKQENAELKSRINDLETRDSAQVNPNDSGNVKSAENVVAKININSADVKTLDSLPGIGEVKAQAIIDWRNAKGNFRNIEDIMNVSGIGQATFNKIKDSITIK